MSLPALLGKDRRTCQVKIGYIKSVQARSTPV